MIHQLDFLDQVSPPRFPSTRYQGSKARFIDWIWPNLASIPFVTCLDAFGGTGCFAYQAKQAGKTVTYNDILPFNAMIGRALIENPGERLTDTEVEALLSPETGDAGPHFIFETFHNIYYTDEENRWLDAISARIRAMSNPYKQAMAYFALFQACLVKRPYNLFHRKNLYLRQQQVQRSFGNKTTWDAPFERHFRKFVGEINQASFAGTAPCTACCADALAVPGDYDLVYIDTPYLNAAGKGVDYADFYHFLNGLLAYDRWGSLIDYASPHRRLRTEPAGWTDAKHIAENFSRLFHRYATSTLAISYRSNGVPSIDELVQLLQPTHRLVKLCESDMMRYALSRNPTQEVLLIAHPLHNAPTNW